MIQKLEILAAPQFVSRTLLFSVAIVCSMLTTQASANYIYEIQNYPSLQKRMDIERSNHD